MKSKLKTKLALILTVATLAGLILVKTAPEVLANCSTQQGAQGNCMDILSFSTNTTTLTASGDASGIIFVSPPDWCPPPDTDIQESDFSSDPMGPTEPWVIVNSGNGVVLSGSVTLNQTQAGTQGTFCPGDVTMQNYQYVWNTSVNISGLAAGNYTFCIQSSSGPCDTTFGDVRSFTKVNPNGTITVSTNNASATWTFPSSASNPCGTCSGTAQTYSSKPSGAYNFSAGAIAGFSVVVTSSGTGGSTCSSGTACTLAGGGQINFTATYTATVGTVTVTTNNAGATWTFPSSASNPCGTCSGTSQTYTSKPSGTYNFSPTRLFATTVASTSSAAAGSSCSSGSTCNLGGASQVNFTATYTNTTCTVKVQGLQNGSIVTPTNQSYTVSGPSNVTATNSSATQTYTLPSDQAGTSYSFTVNSPAAKATVNGYTSDYTGINAPNLSCTPGQTITFTIGYKSEPVLQVQ